MKDSYTDNNGTKWTLCSIERSKRKVEPRAPLVINSYLHSLTVTQHIGQNGVNMDILLIVHNGNFSHHRGIRKIYTVVRRPPIRLFIIISFLIHIFLKQIFLEFPSSVVGFKINYYNFFLILLLYPELFLQLWIMFVSVAIVSLKIKLHRSIRS